MKNQKYILLLTLFFLFFTIPTVSAQELDLSVTPEVSPTAAPVAYQLPYPGVLPGHFLYKLKAARDLIMSYLISDPIKKAEFDLLQSDKRFQAAYLLIEQEKEKADVASETVSKAQNYFEEAVVKTFAAKKEGMDIHDLDKRLILSQAKHAEILMAIEKKAGPDEKKRFKEEQAREVDFAKKVTQLKP
jgi:hypothetical protein